MTEEKNKPQETSADDFFSADPTAQASQARMPQDMGDVGSMVKDSLKQSATYTGKYMIIDLLLNVLPISEYRQRQIARRLASGEKLSLFEILFGRFTIGRIIGWVIGGAILIFVLIQLANSGLLGMLR